MASEPAPVPSEPDVDIMNAPSADTGEEPHCRICRSEGTPEEPLYHPCKCSGSIKYVHQEWYPPPSNPPAPLLQTADLQREV